MGWGGNCLHSSWITPREFNSKFRTKLKGNKGLPRIKVHPYGFHDMMVVKWQFALFWELEHWNQSKKTTLFDSRLPSFWGDKNKAVCHIKPWPKGLASRCNFWTCISFGHPLACTCIDFGRAQIWMQVDATFLPFGHPAQVDTCWSQVICCYKNALTDEMHEIYGFLRLVSRLANLFGHPSQVRTQVLVWQTCIDLRVCLAKAKTKFPFICQIFITQNFQTRFPVLLWVVIT